MSNTVAALRVSVDALEKLVHELGDKASWSPLGKGRTALHQVAECALIAGACAGIIRSKFVPEMDWEAFGRAQAALAEDKTALLSALRENTEALIVAVEGLSEEEARFEVTLPWGEVVTLAGLADMTYWNNTYHQGQINYIQTLL